MFYALLHFCIQKKCIYFTGIPQKFRVSHWGFKHTESFKTTCTDRHTQSLKTTCIEILRAWRPRAQTHWELEDHVHRQTYWELEDYVHRRTYRELEDYVHRRTYWELEDHVHRQTHWELEDHVHRQTHWELEDHVHRHTESLKTTWKDKHVRHTSRKTWKKHCRGHNVDRSTKTQGGTDCINLAQNTSLLILELQPLQSVEALVTTGTSKQHNPIFNCI
jgi:hypothetical protein